MQMSIAVATDYKITFGSPISRGSTIIIDGLHNLDVMHTVPITYTKATMTGE